MLFIGGAVLPQVIEVKQLGRVYPYPSQPIGFSRGLSLNSWDFPPHFVYREDDTVYHRRDLGHYCIKGAQRNHINEIVENSSQ